MRALAGSRFGRLVVIASADRIDRKGHLVRYWSCVCDCGNTIEVHQAKILKGHTKSCGCLRQEALSKARTTHGRAKTPEWNVWQAIKKRCLNPNDSYYYLYGGRGITICSRWRDHFESFFEDMGPRPSPVHSIDRIDSMKGYTPENCRWATPVEQSRNRRNNIRVSYKGRNVLLVEAAKLAGLHYRTLKSRYYRGDRGEVLFRPSGLRRSQVNQ